MPPASFSPRKHPQRSPLGEQAVLAAWGGRVRKVTPPVLPSAAALLNGLFEQPVNQPDGRERRDARDGRKFEVRSSGFEVPNTSNFEPRTSDCARLVHQAVS